MHTYMHAYMCTQTLLIQSSSYSCKVRIHACMHVCKYMCGCITYIHAYVPTWTYTQTDFHRAQFRRLTFYAYTHMTNMHMLVNPDENIHRPQNLYRPILSICTWMYIHIIPIRIQGITKSKKLAVAYYGPFSKPRFLSFKELRPSPPNRCVLLRNWPPFACSAKKII